MVLIVIAVMVINGGSGDDDGDTSLDNYFLLT